MQKSGGGESFCASGVLEVKATLISLVHSVWWQLDDFKSWMDVKHLAEAWVQNSFVTKYLLLCGQKSGDYDSQGAFQHDKQITLFRESIIQSGVNMNSILNSGSVLDEFCSCGAVLWQLWFGPGLCLPHSNSNQDSWVFLESTANRRDKKFNLSLPSPPTLWECNAKSLENPFNENKTGT